ncbi:Ribose ABC transport system permease protein RbsC (TC 3.A.1.2.1) [Patulibacter medicamentivorans]|uniref:Ribose ABC transport system permease protein RbsC (TC 3.A.1.2.1) n=1 Tax=Patulibacter medicamentivorans TaxID=1097667 RepID=H0E722_9ACTN|nr:ABC transporter permease [Patulibacter medicamentivorans]EHN10517.1 Ribose ABC transport system permease protein RbsC (TC 3.A.1.2.1) [Patulibacter medicamentivorans]
MTRLRAPRIHLSTVSAFALCAVLFVIATLHASGFASGDNVRQLLVFASFVGFAALGQTLVVLSGGMDLSVPWLMAFGGIQLSHWATGGMPGGAAIALVVLVGALIGVVNGVGVAFLRIPPIIMTLAVGGLVQAYLLSLGLLDSSGKSPVPAAAVSAASDRLGPLPIVAWVWLVVAVAVGLLLSRSAAGRRIYAVGANEEVARLSGIDVARVRLAAYALSGAAAAFAGVILAGYVGNTYLDIGQPYLFASIAAVVVGGASILGGHGTYWGTVAGALTLTVLSAMLPLFHLSDAGLKVVYGVVILLGVWLSQSGGELLARVRRRATISPEPPHSPEVTTSAP